MSDEQDARDVNRVLSGDVNAFEGIVRRWQRQIVTLAFRFCRDRERAEEMAHVAFLRAFRALGQWRGQGAFGGWLHSVAVNVYRSEMRRNRLLMLSLDCMVDGMVPRNETSSDPDADRKEFVRYAVSTLPARYRDTIILFYFQRMDIRETARCLKVAEGTVKARLHRGRARLRKILGPLLEEDASGRENE